MRITWISLAVLPALASQGSADFVLVDAEHLDVTSLHLGGVLWDTSSAHVMAGGRIGQAHVHDTARLSASGGNVSALFAHAGSTVNISGGSFVNVFATGTGEITFHGTDFATSLGLVLLPDGETLAGAGRLSGRWFDGTPWSTMIIGQGPESTIRVVPEPATLGLLLVAGPAVVRRRRRTGR